MKKGQFSKIALTVKRSCIATVLIDNDSNNRETIGGNKISYPTNTIFALGNDELTTFFLVKNTTVLNNKIKNNSAFLFNNINELAKPIELNTYLKFLRYFV